MMQKKRPIPGEVFPLIEKYIEIDRTLQSAQAARSAVEFPPRKLCSVDEYNAWVERYNGAVDEYNALDLAVEKAAHECELLRQNIGRTLYGVQDAMNVLGYRFWFTVDNIFRIDRGADAKPAKAVVE